MNLQRTGVVAAAVVALMGSLALPAQAQPAAAQEAKVYRMEIWNGPNRTVHYSPANASPGEESALRDLERAENGVAAAEELQGLRRLYLRNERILEERRGVVNPLLYGYSSEYGVTSFGGGFAGFGGYPYGYPYGIGGFGNIGGFGISWGRVASSDVTNSIAQGIGNEGVIKNELARTLADPSASDAYARAARAYNDAWARVRQNERLMAALEKGGAPVAPVADVKLTLKDGTKLEGKLLREEPEFIVVRKADGWKRTIKTSDITEREEK